MAQEHLATPSGPDASEVLRALAEELGGLEGNPTRITVEAGSPTSYVARVYLSGDADYEGYELSFD